MLLCVTSLYAMDADAPLQGRSHETGSSSSNSSVVADAVEMTSGVSVQFGTQFSEVPRELVLQIIQSHDFPGIFEELEAGHAILAKNPEETVQDRVETMYQLNKVEEIYFTETTKGILNQSDNGGVNRIPTSLNFRIKPTAQEVEKLARQFPNIEKINLGYRLKDVDGKIDIIKALGGFKKLAEIDLSYNGITDDEAVALAGSMQGLKVLNLFENRIEDGGITAIATHLTELTSLNIAGNSIWNHEAIMAIGQNLNNLTHLYIFSNIYVIGVDVVESLQKLTNLSTLLIGNGRDTVNEDCISLLRSGWKGDPSKLGIDN